MGKAKEDRGHDESIKLTPEDDAILDKIWDNIDNLPPAPRPKHSDPDTAQVWRSITSEAMAIRNQSGPPVSRTETTNAPISHCL